MQQDHRRARDLVPDSSRRDALRFGGAALAATAGAVTLGGTTPAAAQTLTPVYLPIGPFRLYDTRQVDGKILNGWTRILDVQPLPEEYADCYNVTVTETAGAGWLAIFPGDIAWPGSSSINWFGPNQNLANNAYTEIAGNGTIAVRCGGPSTHFILDLVAALVFVDLSGAGAAASATSATRELARRLGERPVRMVDEFPDG